MQKIKECKKCGGTMRMVAYIRRFLRPDELDFESMTEGEIADYNACLMAGDLSSDWVVEEEVYICGKCGHRLIDIIV